MSDGTASDRPKRKSRTQTRVSSPRRGGTSGKFRIGDNWNAITIIALSQNNPLKAIAEFVENSIDAHATSITLIRGRERGEHYLKVIDDGDGIPRDGDGVPDFRYVATHICDSLKRRLKAEGIQGIQGEFGIGLLSFWTVGERMILSSSGSDGKTWQMEMNKNEPGYAIGSRKTLFSHPGTELLIRPLLPGLRQLSGEKIQNYLAAELRDRIRKSGVRIRILDRAAKKELEVQPRQYTGRLLHELSGVTTELGEVYLELYLNSPGPENQISLFRSGTRVVASVTELDPLNGQPWNSGYLEGMIDAPFLQLTPGTRGGVVRDKSFETLCGALKPIAEKLTLIIEQEKLAEEEEASRNILKSVQKALKEAFLALPPEDYHWFDIHTGARKQPPSMENQRTQPEAEAPESGSGADGKNLAPLPIETSEKGAAEREFFDFPGPLFSTLVSPASAVMKVKTERGFRCIPRDKSRRPIERNVDIRWSIREGDGRLSAQNGEIVTFTAPDEPGLTILRVEAAQGEFACSAESIITVAETLLEREPGEQGDRGKGLPGYTFLRAPGELWRSRYDEKNNLVVINNGHRDYLYASQKHARKLKYICRLFSKELVLANFPGFERSELMERMIELSLYTEEHLR